MNRNNPARLPLTAALPSTLPAPRCLSTTSTPVVDCFDCVRQRLFGENCVKHFTLVEVRLPVAAVQVQVKGPRDSEGREVSEFTTATIPDGRDPMAGQRVFHRYNLELDRPEKILSEKLNDKSCSDFKEIGKRDFIPNVSCSDTVLSNVYSLENGTKVPSSISILRSNPKFKDLYTDVLHALDTFRGSGVFTVDDPGQYEFIIAEALFQREIRHDLKYLTHKVLYEYDLSYTSAVQRGILFYIHAGKEELLEMLCSLRLFDVSTLSIVSVTRMIGLGLPCYTTNLTHCKLHLPVFALSQRPVEGARVSLILPHENAFAEALSFAFGNISLLPSAILDRVETN